MPLMNEIPDSFWSLFRSYNRETYIEALLKISEEYQYNNYYLSREVCIQVLADYFSQRRISIMQEEQETDADVLEPPATRILNWLVRTGWLKRLEDYTAGVTNIIIPDYSAVFIDAFERLFGEDEDDTEIYIQNIYAILYSYRNDAKGSERLLKTALVNTRKLNKALQDMLHNMDKFFDSLLEKNFYGDLLKEHLNGYVQEIVRKKYHILKTSDNFYIYKNDIKQWLKEIRENLARSDAETIEIMETVKKAEGEPRDATGAIEREADTDLAGRWDGKYVHTADSHAQSAADMVDQIERGFDDIEHRIANMDREHMKYVRATVTRLNYLLNEEEDMRGMIVSLLNRMSGAGDRDEILAQAAARMNFSQIEIISEKSLYKRRKGKAVFRDNLEPDEEMPELAREDVLRLNRIHNRYSRKEIEAFIEGRMQGDCLEVGKDFVHSDEDFEMLILAYDYAARKGSRYRVRRGEEQEIDSGRYRYPALIFERVKVRRNEG